MEIVRWDKESKILHIKIGGVLYKTKVLSVDEDDRSITLYVFNMNTTITLPLTENVSKEILENPAQNTVLSPIAGRVVKVHVKEKETVEYDEPLVTIESMKMENEIRAPFSLFVKTVHIDEGDLVKQDELLVTVEQRVTDSL